MRLSTAAAVQLQQLDQPSQSALISAAATLAHRRPLPTGVYRHVTALEDVTAGVVAERAGCTLRVPHRHMALSPASPLRGSVRSWPERSAHTQAAQ